MSSTTQFVERAGAKLACDVNGEGDAVLLIHAGIADRRMWDDQLPALAQRYQVIRFDLQGYGETVDGSGPVYHHEDALAVLDAVGVEKAAVVGASIGGSADINLALTHPERVSALVLVGSALDGYESSDEAASRLWAAAEEAFESGDTQRAADIIIDMWVPSASDQVRQRLVGMIVPTFDRDELDEREMPDAATRLTTISVPTLVIVGDHDRPAFPRIAALMADTIPDARLVTMPGVGHLPSMEDPETFTAHLMKFLGEVLGDQK